MSADHVTCVSIGARMPPVARRCIANTVPMTPAATTRAGLRVAQVVSMYTPVEAGTGWGDAECGEQGPAEEDLLGDPIGERRGQHQ